MLPTAEGGIRLRNSARDTQPCGLVDRLPAIVPEADDGIGALFFGRLRENNNLYLCWTTHSITSIQHSWLGGRELEDALIDTPLGPEDASRREDIEDSFVDVGQLIAGTRISSNAAPVRVVVGRKGSGKTHVLRHIENLSKDAGRDVAFCVIDRDLLSEGALRPFSDSANITTFWTDLWRLAVIAAVLSRFTARKLDARATRAMQKRTTTSKELERDYEKIYFSAPRPFDPVSAIYRIRARYRSEESLRELFRTLIFSDLEADLGQLLQHYGEIHFIVDGLDEFAWMNPRAWLNLQIGLFKLVFLQSASRSYIRSVHLTISMRNYVYGHAMQDTHSDRVGVGTGIVKLTWDKDAASRFLNHRLQQVAQFNFARAKNLLHERPLANWLGFEVFKPFRRPKPELVEYYLLRHTRCAPRQVIKTFNVLCSEQNKLSITDKIVEPERFREIISFQSRESARNSVQTAAEELLAIFQYDTQLPRVGSQREAAKDYYISTVSNALMRAISKCRCEITDRKLFRDNALVELRPHFEASSDTELVDKIEETAWRSGIIAYPVTGERGMTWRYTWGEGEFGFIAPLQSSSTIGFHPTMIDLCELTVHENGPVF